MPTNTTYNPVHTDQFEKSKLNKDAKGVLGVAVAGASTQLDLTLTDDVLISGGHGFLAKGAAWGDKVDFQVVHPIAGLVLQFLTGWYVNPDQTQQAIPSSSYPAKLPAGLILRVVYHSVGGTDVDIAVNYNLEKVLV